MAEPLLVRFQIAIHLDPAIVAQAANAAPGNTLPCVPVEQEKDKTNWCWAAVTECVERSYDPAWNGQQCQIAALVYPNDGCCGPPAGEGHPCNNGAYLSDALGALNRFDDLVAPDFPTARFEVDERRLAPVHVSWLGAGGDGHYTVIHGYTTTSEGDAVVCADPKHGPQITPVVDMDDGLYVGDGQWDNLYFTFGSVP